MDYPYDPTYSTSPGGDMLQAILERIRQGASAGAPSAPQPLMSPQPSGPDENSLMSILNQPPPQMQAPSDAGPGLGRSLLSGLADALGAYAASVGRNPSLQPHANERLRAQVASRNKTAADVANYNQQAIYGAKQKAAETGLGLIERRRSEQSAADRETARIAQTQAGEASRQKSDADLRRDLAANQQAMEAQLSRESNAVRLEIASRDNATKIREQELRSTTQSDIDKVEERTISREQRDRLLQAKQGVQAYKANLSTLLETKTPEQLRQEWIDKMDSAGLIPGRPERKAAMDYWIDKIEPTLLAQEAGPDISAADLQERKTVSDVKYLKEHPNSARLMMRGR